MPSYFYHLNLELYAHPKGHADPDTGVSGRVSKPGPKKRARDRKERDKEKNDGENNFARVPPTGTDIFGERWTSKGAKTGGKEEEGKGTIAPEDIKRDWRFGPVRIEAVDMPPLPQPPDVGRVTKAEFRAIQTGGTDVGWGVVRLYRDGEESGSFPEENERGAGEKEKGEEDYTTLCIPAVPSYLTPSDFLGFVGEKTRAEVSHFRMVMTGRMNRYLVLMKFRDGGVARKWRTAWDGRVFNSVEVSFSPLKKRGVFGLCWINILTITARDVPCHVHQVDHIPDAFPPKCQLP